MAQYCGQPNLADYLDFATSADAPVKAIVCPFVQGGAGVPGPVLSLVVFGGVGLTLSYRIRHPGPIVAAGVLTGGVAAASAPGAGMNLFALAMFAALSALGLFLYARAQSSL